MAADIVHEVLSAHFALIENSRRALFKLLESCAAYQVHAGENVNGPVSEFGFTSGAPQEFHSGEAGKLLFDQQNVGGRNPELLQSHRPIRGKVHTPACDAQQEDQDQASESVAVSNQDSLLFARVAR